MAATLSSLNLPPRIPRPSHCHKSKFNAVSFKDNDLSLHLPKLPSTIFPTIPSVYLPLTSVTLPFFVCTKDALAAGGEFGILEGRTFALIHPLAMSGLFVYTLWAGYLGWQWRRVRTLQDEINELKKQGKPTPVTADGSPPAELPPPSLAELKIQQLTEVISVVIAEENRNHFTFGLD